jgi:hypothetical protein
MSRRPKPALLTIGEVAARIRHLAADPFALAERCRHWAKLGLLASAARHAEGTGKHKLYDPQVIYDAALLIILADAGIEPGRYVVEANFKPDHEERIVGGELQWLRNALHWARQARMFEWKKSRARGEPLYLEVFLAPRGKHYGEVHNGTPTPIEEIAKRSKVNPAEARPAFSIKFDLGMLFESVAKSVEEGAEESAAA